MMMMMMWMMIMVEFLRGGPRQGGSMLDSEEEEEEEERRRDRYGPSFPRLLGSPPPRSTLYRPFSAAPTSEGDAHAPQIFAPVMFHSETAGMSKCPFL